MGYSHWGNKESDTTEQLSAHTHAVSSYCVIGIYNNYLGMCSVGCGDSMVAVKSSQLCCWLVLPMSKEMPTQDYASFPRASLHPALVQTVLQRPAPQLWLRIYRHPSSRVPCRIIWLFCYYDKATHFSTVSSISYRCWFLGVSPLFCNANIKVSESISQGNWPEIVDYLIESAKHFSQVYSTSILALQVRKELRLKILSSSSIPFFGI